MKVILDFIGLSAAYYLAFLIRFEGNLSPQQFDAMLNSIALVVTFQYLFLVGGRITRLSWQYVGLPEVERVCAALVVANSILLCCAWNIDFFIQLLPGFPFAMTSRGVILIDL